MDEPFPPQESIETTKALKGPEDIVEHHIWENEGGQVERTVKAYRAAGATKTVVEYDPE